MQANENVLLLTEPGGASLLVNLRQPEADSRLLPASARQPLRLPGYPESAAGTCHPTDDRAIGCIPELW